MHMVCELQAKKGILTESLSNTLSHGAQTGRSLQYRIHLAITRMPDEIEESKRIVFDDLLFDSLDMDMVKQNRWLWRRGDQWRLKEQTKATSGKSFCSMRITYGFARLFLCNLSFFGRFSLTPTQSRSFLLLL